MNWNQITTEDQLEEIINISAEKPVLIFKHSRTCSISSTALSRLERSWNLDESKDLQPYFLDLQAHRNVSQKIASTFSVEHESPQAIILKNGIAIYHDSHFGISFDDMISSI